MREYRVRYFVASYTPPCCFGSQLHLESSISPIGERECDVVCAPTAAAAPSDVAPSGDYGSARPM
jgi:hypothetical protein